MTSTNSFRGDNSYRRNRSRELLEQDRRQVSRGRASFCAIGINAIRAAAPPRSLQPRPKPTNAQLLLNPYLPRGVLRHFLQHAQLIRFRRRVDKTAAQCLAGTAKEIHAVWQRSRRGDSRAPPPPQISSRVIATEQATSSPRRGVLSRFGLAGVRRGVPRAGGGGVRCDNAH